MLADGRVVTLRTAGGDIACMRHDPDGLPPDRGSAERALLWIGGAGGGLDGPAGGIDAVLEARIVSLRLDYRSPSEFDECVMDAVVGIDWLCALRRGGAVAIAAAVADACVGAVVAMSSLTYGAHAVGLLTPRPLLLMHGEADDVLPAACSRWLFGAPGSRASCASTRGLATASTSAATSSNRTSRSGWSVAGSERRRPRRCSPQPQRAGCVAARRPVGCMTPAARRGRWRQGRKPLVFRVSCALRRCGGAALRPAGSAC